MIKTLSDAVTIVEFLVSRQGKSIGEAMKEAEVPMYLKEQVIKYFSPPLEIISPDLIVSNQSILRCNPDTDSMQQYFGSFQRFMIDERHWSKSTVDTLSETSLDLIRRFPKPDSLINFQCRGLVVGHIQSGKTANMAALICRAADEGYKLFIVLGGFWKDLRAQTQRRFDQEIIGESDDPVDYPCVLHDPSTPRWVRLTGSGLENDFVPGPNDLNPKTPKLAVIKKNKRIESLMQWLQKSPVPLADLPAIIIDDEADQGSIDTNYGRVDDEGEKIDPSTTNRRIRDLLKLLPKCVYVGFTATPFANVLIDFSSEDDLYPRDFIATLPEPPGYFGPRKLFGLGMEPSDLSPMPAERPPLDLIRRIGEEDLSDLDNVIIGASQSCPRVLSDALLAFILSSCGRLARGHDRDHFSMLVHTSSRTDPHKIFADTIREELKIFKNVTIRPKLFPEVIKRAREMWDSDFSKITEEQKDTNLPVYDFDTVWKFAKSLTESIEVKVLNTYSTDKLDYAGYPKRYVVVGGNRLSRGLTLEGLSVSVFTRSANQYDTLLQMGRWFGFRPQYHDLTRIFVESQLSERFAELARVEEELRADLSKYAQQPDPPTPLDLRPIIRSHPTMAITSRMKMGAGHPLYLSFQNTTQQTVSFPVDNNALLRKNLDAVRAFIADLPSSIQSDSNEGAHMWADVSSEKIIEFLQDYEFSREAREVNRQHLISYISRQNNRGELVNWDIVLPRGNPKLGPFKWTGDILTRKIVRFPMTSKSIKVLFSPNDGKIWQEKLQRDLKDCSRGCIMLYIIDRNSGLESDIKFFRNQDEAEDIVGLVFIFPESKSNETIEYVSQ